MVVFSFFAFSPVFLLLIEKYVKMLKNLIQTECKAPICWSKYTHKKRNREKIKRERDRGRERERERERCGIVKSKTEKNLT